MICLACLIQHNYQESTRTLYSHVSGIPELTPTPIVVFDAGVPIVVVGAGVVQARFDFFSVVIFIVVTSAATVDFVILYAAVVCAAVVVSVTETVSFNGIDVVLDVIAVVSAVDDLIPSPIFLVLIAVVDACVV